MTNRVDETTDFEYTEAGFPDYLTDIFDARGIQAIRTEYDDEGRILRQIDAEGNPFEFIHDLDTFTETVTDRLGNTTTYEYDDLGNVTRMIDPTGAETRYEYYPGTELVKFETDDLGNVVAKAYDSQENVLVEITGADINEEPLFATTGYITRYTYNAFSSPLTITDPNGNLTEFVYDAQGNLLFQRQYGEGGEVLESGFTYHASGDIHTMTDALGNITEYTYDYGSFTSFSAAVKRQTVTVNDASEGVLRITESFYDLQDNLIAERFDRTLPNSSVETVLTTYAYDQENRLIATFLPDGQVSETRYNTIGKESASIRWQSSADYLSGNTALARVTTMSYDDRGDLIRTDYPDGTHTRTGYNAEGRQIWTTNQLGELTAMAYDALGRQTDTIMADPVGDPDANTLATLSWNSYSELPAVLQDNPTTGTIYDSIGRVEFSIDELGNITENIYDDACACSGRLKETRRYLTELTWQTTSYTYDENGNQRFVTDPKGFTTEFVYDSYNRLTQTNHPDTAEHGATATRTVYDALGRRIATIDEEEKGRAFAYDALGRLRAVGEGLALSELPAPQVFDVNDFPKITRYSYDQAGNLITETDAENQITRFAYDSSGRRTQRTLPEGQVEIYQYNGWGELEYRTDFNGRTTTYSYDSMGRLLIESADAVAFPFELGIAYAYDALGRVETMTDASGTTTYTYDERGNLESKADATGTLTYTYDDANNLKTTSSDSVDGLFLSYDYDGFNRLEWVTDTGPSPTQRQHQYTYDANGNLETLSYHNGVVHTWTYDTRNRLKTLTTTDSLLNTLTGYTYSLKESGHRLRISEQGGRIIDYQYDAYDRLTQESVTGSANALLNGTSDWSYDLVGNRLTQTTGLNALPNQVHTYSANNWLDGDLFDSNGNTESSSSAILGEAVIDVYDWRNRLVRREKPDGSTIEIVYNGMGDRIRKTLRDTGGSLVDETWYLVDRNNLTGYAQVVEESDQAGTVEVVYTYGLDLISQNRFSSGAPIWTPSFYLYDGLGSVRALTDESGSVTERYTYDAWGVLLETLHLGASPTENAYRFTGEQWDEDLEMVFLRARYLNTTTGRFHTLDTYEGRSQDPVTLHKYLYANANPIMGIDPSGNATIGINSHLLVANVIGTLARMATPSALKALSTASVNFTASALFTVGSIQAVEALIVTQSLTRPESKRDFTAELDKIAKRKRKSDNVVFLHGSSTGAWSGAYDDIRPIGDGDFGEGFYTFRYPEGIESATDWARAVQNGEGGIGFVSIFAIRKSTWDNMRKLNRTHLTYKASRDWRAEVIIGPLSGTGNFSTQYKFQNSGISKLASGFRGVIPIY